MQGLQRFLCMLLTAFEKFVYQNVCPVKLESSRTMGGFAITKEKYFITTNHKSFIAQSLVIKIYTLACGKYDTSNKIQYDLFTRENITNEKQENEIIANQETLAKICPKITMLYAKSFVYLFTCFKEIRIDASKDVLLYSFFLLRREASPVIF